jgi:pyruvate kinase
MLELFTTSSVNYQAYSFWITAKSHFRKEIVDNLLLDRHTIGIRYNISKENNINVLGEAIKYVNENYPNISVMLDMSGEKQRIKIENGPLVLKKGEICLVADKDSPVNYDIGIDHYMFQYIIKNCIVDDFLLISDGWQKLIIKEKNDNIIVCEVAFDCEIYHNRGISAKGLYDTLPQNFSKDLQKCEKLNKLCDYNNIAVSFVNDRKIIESIRQNFDEEIKITAKIESMTGLRNIMDIAQVADLVMIARGDLLVEISYYNLSLLKAERYIASCCELLNKEFIIATRVADSLETDTEMSFNEIITFSSNLLKYKNPVFLLAAETSYNQNKAVENFMKLIDNADKILSIL